MDDFGRWRWGAARLARSSDGSHMGQSCRLAALAGCLTVLLINIPALADPAYRTAQIRMPSPATSSNEGQPLFIKISRVAGAAQAPRRCDLELDDKAVLRYLAGISLSEYGSDPEKVLSIVKTVLFAGAGNRDKNPAFCASAVKLYGQEGQWAKGLLTGSGAPKPD